MSSTWQSRRTSDIWFGSGSSSIGSASAGTTPRACSRRICRSIRTGLTESWRAPRPARIGVLPLHVSREAYVCKNDVLASGYELWGTDMAFQRDYVLPMPASDFQGCIRRPTKYSDRSSFGRLLLLELVVPGAYSSGTPLAEAPGHLLVGAQREGGPSFSRSRRWLRQVAARLPRQMEARGAKRRPARSSARSRPESPMCRGGRRRISARASFTTCTEVPHRARGRPRGRLEGRRHAPLRATSGGGAHEGVARCHPQS